MCNLSQGILQTGIEKGRAETTKAMALELNAMGVELDKIARAAKVTVGQIKAWIAENK